MQQLLLDVELRELLDPSRLSPERFEIERLNANPVGIVGLQSLENSGIDVSHVPAFEDRAIPGFVAGRAFVDQPCIELPPVGVDSDLLAALERPEAAASTARDPRSGRDPGSNGPADLKRIAHAVLVFRSEVHQDGSASKPLGRGMALFGDES